MISQDQDILSFKILISYFRLESKALPQSKS